MDHHRAFRPPAGQRRAQPTGGPAPRCRAESSEQDCPIGGANWRGRLAKMIILFAVCQMLHLAPMLQLGSALELANTTNINTNTTQQAANATIIPQSLLASPAANGSETAAPVKLVGKTAAAKRLAVLCNSRCSCVLLEPLPAVKSERPHNESSSSSSSSSTNSSSSGEPDGSGTNKWPSAELRQPLERALLAFSDDYSLDYGEPDLEESAKAGKPAGQLEPSNSIIGGAQKAKEITASGQSSWLELMQTGHNQQPLEANTTTTLGASRVANTSGPTGPNVVVARQPQLAQSAPSPQKLPFPAPDPPIQLHQLHRPREPTGPQLYAQSLYSSQAPKLSYHAHKGYLGRAPSTGGAPPVEPMLAPPGGHAARHGRFFGRHSRPDHARPLTSSPTTPHRLVPLRGLDLSKQLALRRPLGSAALQNLTSQQVVADWEREQPQFVQAVEQMLDQLASQDIQSLALRYNELQFELWSELYALLAPSLHQQLFQLDLSHNALSKLGATFTGYIEHYLSVHNSWPQVGNSTVSQPMTAEQQAVAKTDAKLARARRYTLLSDGKLFTLIQRHQRLNMSATNQTGGLQPLLQQPIVLRALDLSHNRLKWLINDQFKTLKHVQAIRLDHNRIRYIHQHAFSGLESLRYLNLNFNRLQVIYIEQFQTNYNLLALMFRSNYLAYLRGGSFASLANLKRLDLSMNKLTILSQNAFIGLESLELLNCSGNQFVHAPSASLHPLISLRQLDLSENLIAQLAPGAFFHLPIEELILNENEQLVAIERGAFWDLPYLRHLSLSSNPMLMSINSQAFVGTPALQTIEAENCPSLESAARQLFENVTMAATSRLLLHKTDGLQSETTDNKRIQPGLDLAALADPLPASVVNETFALPTGQPSAISDNIKQILELQSSRLKYVYYGATLSLLVVALKLVFKYTSTSHYIESKRRRRRVYEASSSSPSLNCSQDLNAKSTTHNAELEADFSLSMSSHHDYFQMCVQQPNNFVIGAAAARQQQQERQKSLDDEQDQDAQPSDYTEQQAGSYESNNNLADYQISVITDGRQLATQPTSPTHISTCCPDCPAVSSSGCCNQTVQMGEEVDSQDEHRQQDQQQQQLVVEDLNQQAANMQHQHSALGQLNLIHSQQVTTGYDLGHADCDHFYQSLEPALQLADMTDDYVDGYY